MPSSTANTTTFEGFAECTVKFTVSPGFTSAGASTDTALRRASRFTENGTTP